METERVTGDETGDRKDIKETEGQDNDDHSEQGRVGAGAWGLQETDKMEKSKPRFYTGSESQEKSLSGPRSQSEAIRGKSSATAIWAETHTPGGTGKYATSGGSKSPALIMLYSFSDW